MHPQLLKDMQEQQAKDRLAEAEAYRLAKIARSDRPRQTGVLSRIIRWALSIVLHRKVKQETLPEYAPKKLKTQEISI